MRLSFSAACAPSSLDLALHFKPVFCSSLTFGLILIWISQELPKTPEEIAALLWETITQDAF